MSVKQIDDAKIAELVIQLTLHNLRPRQRIRYAARLFQELGWFNIATEIRRLGLPDVFIIPMDELGGKGWRIIAGLVAKSTRTAPYVIFLPIWNDIN